MPRTTTEQQTMLDTLNAATRQLITDLKAVLVPNPQQITEHERELLNDYKQGTELSDQARGALEKEITPNRRKDLIEYEIMCLREAEKPNEAQIKALSIHLADFCFAEYHSLKKPKGDQKSLEQQFSQLKENRATLEEELAELYKVEIKKRSAKQKERIQTIEERLDIITNDIRILALACGDFYEAAPYYPDDIWITYFIAQDAFALFAVIDQFDPTKLSNAGKALKNQKEIGVIGDQIKYIFNHMLRLFQLFNRDTWLPAVTFSNQSFCAKLLVFLKKITEPTYMVLSAKFGNIKSKGGVLGAIKSFGVERVQAEIIDLLVNNLNNEQIQALFSPPNGTKEASFTHKPYEEKVQHVFRLMTKTFTDLAGALERNITSLPEKIAAKKAELVELQQKTTSIDTTSIHCIIDLRTCAQTILAIENTLKALEVPNTPEIETIKSIISQKVTAFADNALLAIANIKKAITALPEKTDLQPVIEECHRVSEHLTLGTNKLGDFYSARLDPQEFSLLQINTVLNKVFHVITEQKTAFDKNIKPDFEILQKIQAYLAATDTIALPSSLKTQQQSLQDIMAKAPSKEDIQTLSAPKTLSTTLISSATQALEKRQSVLSLYSTFLETVISVQNNLTELENNVPQNTALAETKNRYGKIKISVINAAKVNLIATLQDAGFPKPVRDAITQHAKTYVERIQATVSTQLKTLEQKMADPIATAIGELNEIIVDAQQYLQDQERFEKELQFCEETLLQKESIMSQIQTLVGEKTLDDATADIKNALNQNTRMHERTSAQQTTDNTDQQTLRVIETALRQEQFGDINIADLQGAMAWTDKTLEHWLLSIPELQVQYPVPVDSWYNRVRKSWGTRHVAYNALSTIKRWGRKGCSPLRQWRVIGGLARRVATPRELLLQAVQNRIKALEEKNEQHTRTLVACEQASQTLTKKKETLETLKKQKDALDSAKQHKPRIKQILADVEKEFSAKKTTIKHITASLSAQISPLQTAFPDAQEDISKYQQICTCLQKMTQQDGLPQQSLARLTVALQPYTYALFRTKQQSRTTQQTTTRTTATSNTTRQTTMASPRNSPNSRFFKTTEKTNCPPFITAIRNIIQKAEGQIQSIVTSLNQDTLPLSNHDETSRQNQEKAKRTAPYQAVMQDLLFIQTKINTMLSHTTPPNTVTNTQVYNVIREDIKRIKEKKNIDQTLHDTLQPIYNAVAQKKRNSPKQLRENEHSVQIY